MRKGVNERERDQGKEKGSEGRRGGKEETRESRAKQEEATWFNYCTTRGSILIWFQKQLVTYKMAVQGDSSHQLTNSAPPKGNHTLHLQEKEIHKDIPNTLKEEHMQIPITPSSIQNTSHWQEALTCCRTCGCHGDQTDKQMVTSFLVGSVTIPEGIPHSIGKQLYSTAQIYVDLSIYLHVYILYLCVYICMYVYANKHTHTHTHCLYTLQYYSDLL